MKVHPIDSLTKLWEKQHGRNMEKMQEIQQQLIILEQEINAIKEQREHEDTLRMSTLP